MPLVLTQNGAENYSPLAKNFEKWQKLPLVATPLFPSLVVVVVVLFCFVLNCKRRVKINTTLLAINLGFGAQFFVPGSIHLQVSKQCCCWLSIDV